MGAGGNMTRTPDFYRVVRVGKDGDRVYLNQLNQFAHGAHNAFPFSDVSLAQDDARRYYAHVVHVYVKVTRKPKLHDFGWALARMREGKRVRLCGWDTGYWIMLINDATFTANWLTSRVAVLNMEWILATSWQLYEPEAK